MTNNMNATTGGRVLLTDDDQRVRELFATLTPDGKAQFIHQAACFLEVQSWPSSALELHAVANL